MKGTGHWPLREIERDETVTLAELLERAVEGTARSVGPPPYSATFSAST
jgi:hypothetical protein